MLFVILHTARQLAEIYLKGLFVRSIKRFKLKGVDLLKPQESGEGRDKIENKNYLV